MKKKFSKNQNGFTIIEIIVSIAILMIVSIGAAGMYINQIKLENENTIEYKLRYLRDSITTMFLENMNINYPTNGSFYFWCASLDAIGIANTANFADTTAIPKMPAADICSKPHLCKPNSVVVQLSNSNIVSGTLMPYSRMIYIDYLDENENLKRSFQQEIPFYTNNSSTVPLASIIGPGESRFGPSYTQYQAAGCPAPAVGCVNYANGIVICW